MVSLSHGKPTPSSSHITAIVLMETIGHVKLSLFMPQRHIRREEVYPHSFLTQYYMRMTGQLRFPATLPPEKNPKFQ